MSNWPLPSAGRYESIGFNAADSGGASVTAGGSTKGAWTQLVASTSFDYTSGLASFVQVGSATTTLLMDIGIGASGSEVVIVDSLFWDDGSFRNGATFLLPITIPLGSRVSVRGQYNGGGTLAIDATFIGISGGLNTDGFSFSKIKSMGVDLSATSGMTLDPGGTLNTKGAFVEIISSTPSLFKSLMIAMGQKGNTALSAAKFLVDIAIGGSGTEEIIIPDILMASASAKDRFLPMYIGPLPIEIPSGTRISMRMQSSITEATDRLMEFVLYGAG